MSVAWSLHVLYALIKIYSTLEINDIPTKLRCGICSKLAVNAVKLPCCETSICANCELPNRRRVRTLLTTLGQAQLSEQCPVCEHQPVSPDVCTPIKSLRMTVKAHVKTEMKKRAALASVADVPAPAVEPTPTPAPVEDTQAAAVSEKPAADATGVETVPASEVPLAEDSNTANGEPVARTIESNEDAQTGETQAEVRSALIRCSSNLSDIFIDRDRRRRGRRR